MYSGTSGVFAAGEANAEEVLGGDGAGSAAALLDSIGSDEEFESQWQLFDQIYPNSELIWLTKVNRLIRKKAFAEAAELIEAHAFGQDVDQLALIAKADLLYSAHAFDRAAEIFATLMAAFPDRRDIRINYAKRLMADGFLANAYSLLSPLQDSFAEGSKGETLWSKAKDTFELLTELEQGPIAADQDARLLAMKHAILWFRDRELREPAAPGLGRLTLITGSLGPGGAERQLTRLAIELERSRKASLPVGGLELSRPVEIVVRSHGPEKQNDFYLREVQAAGLELYELNEAKPVSAKSLGVEDEQLRILLDYLPPSVNYGVKRLTRHLLDSGTDTASAWQDGACLFAGLAALVAGVPQIQLAIRGLPPILRKHMYRPEYEVMYRALAEIPGVTFLSNNRASARAYAEWLDIPVDRFAIVYNGVEPMPPVGSPACETMWQGFVEATPDATHTIGSVFRFDTDKQPNLWIRFAARYLKAHPRARIVMVGGGRLLEGAQQLAQDLGIAERILFTGRSERVGYWMARMDVLLLLSRYEGLPNVLIEAQYMGVRVVTTPAGGAAECLLNGTTGYVLECTEQPDLDNIVARAQELALRAGDRELFGEDGVGRRFLDDNFSIPRMLDNFVASTAGPLLGSQRPAVREAA
jgi:glycosyltransferase involved in cell wall biosynthesis